VLQDEDDDDEEFEPTQQLPATTTTTTTSTTNFIKIKTEQTALLSGTRDVFLPQVSEEGDLEAG